MMQINTIPQTTLKGPKLILGCMGLGGGWDPKTVLTKDHEKQAREFLEAGLELGANFYDHANIYAQGRAEEVFGRVMKEKAGLRDCLILQSKVGIRWKDQPEGSPQRFDFSRGNILEATNAILKRLGTEYLDILLLHRPDALWQPEEVAEAFALLKGAAAKNGFDLTKLDEAGRERMGSVLTQLRDLIDAQGLDAVSRQQLVEDVARQLKPV